MQKNRLLKFILLISLCFTSSVLAKSQIDANILLQNINKQALKNSEIINISRKDLEKTDTSIALSMALYVKAPFKKVLQDIKTSGNALTNYTEAKLVHIKDTANLKPYFSKIGFVKSELNEVEKLFDFDGGDTINLSKEELTKWQSISKNKEVNIELASSFYREILEQRVKEYIKKGVKGIPIYSHLDSDNSVQKGMEESSAFLITFKKLIPDLYKDYIHYPKISSKNIKHNFYLIKDELEGRPTFILKHQMTKESPDAFIVAERQFYISHDLDAIQTQILCMPYKDGTLIALSSQSFTPKVSGFARSVAVEIGRKMMAKEILPMLEKIQKKYK